MKTTEEMTQSSTIFCFQNTMEKCIEHHWAIVGYYKTRCHPGKIIKTYNCHLNDSMVQKIMEGAGNFEMESNSCVHATQRVFEQCVRESVQN